jgi:hypothetical protein
VTAFEPIALVQLRIPRGWPLRDEIDAQFSAIAFKRTANDLFYFPLMQVDARTKHAIRLRGEDANSRAQLGIDKPPVKA